jgi:DNA-binding CsgD family transcriptional regulator
MISRATAGSPHSGVTDALLERDTEVEALGNAVRKAREGQGGIVLVEGATGLGKSRLLAEAAALATAKNMCVLAASGRDLERDLPFGVALQLFEQVARRADEERRAHLFSGSAGLAEPLVLEGAPSPEGLGASLHGLYWLSANLAAEQPVLLVVDDLHWCDPPSVRFLVYLVQRIEELPIAVALAAAEGQLPELEPLLHELRTHPATRVLRPTPLSAEAAARLLSESLLPHAEPAFAEACHEVTGGNPLLLGELATELALQEVEPSDQNVGAVRKLVPETLAAAVLLRLRRVGEGAPDLARAIAVLGEGADLRHAAALAELPPERAARLVEALMWAGVLRRHQRLSFVHPVVRLAVYPGESEWARAEAHRKAAAILMEEADSAERVAPHLLKARPVGDPRAVEILLRAGVRALGGGAPDSAIRLLRRALEEPPSPERRAEVLLALGRAEGAAGAPEAIERLNGVLRTIGEPAGRAAAALEAGRMLITKGLWEDAAETLERGLEEPHDIDDGVRAQLEVAHSSAMRVKPGTRPDPRRIDTADETLERTTAGRVLLAQAAADCALVGTSAAEVRELATRALGGGALLEEETTDGIGFYLAVFALVVAEDLQTAELAASTAVEAAQRRGSVLGFANACHFRSLAELRRGRIPDAAADAVNALAARRYGWRLSVGSALAVVAECHLEEEQLEDAEQQLQSFTDNDLPIGTTAYRFFGARGRLRLMQHAPDRALEDLLEAGRLMEQFGGGNPAVFPWRSLASSASLALGDRAEARRLAEEELALASGFGAAGAVGRALGAVAATAEGSAAIEAREQAVRVLEPSQAALDRARALVDLGAALRRAAKRRDAREPLKMGLDLARRCGSRALARRAREELQAVGARPRRDAATGREALTAREAQVAGLAAQSMSNREIAASLFVTVKTVEWHLKHAYEKLGVRSRRELRHALVPEQEE